MFKWLLISTCIKKRHILTHAEQTVVVRTSRRLIDVIKEDVKLVSVREKDAGDVVG